MDQSAARRDPLLEPFQLGRLALRNRIVSTAHAPAYAEEGAPKDRYRLYHEAKAKGGAALTMIGGSTNVAPDSPSVFGQLYAGDDAIIPWFARLAEGVRRHGAFVFCQLTHMGRRTTWDAGDWLPVIAPSDLRERAHRAQPKAMEAPDVDRVVAAFAAAADRCRRGGLDGVELLLHGHLLGQFLSPLTNRRTDAYGGALENRLRITLEALSAARAALGPDLALGVRMTGDERHADGLSPEEAVAAAEILDRSGLVDFFNVLAGAPFDDQGLAEWVPPMGFGLPAHFQAAQGVRKAVSKPVISAGGVNDLETARHMLRSGAVDLVGMTRAQMADPELANKLAAGRAAEIRPCVGLGYCVDRVNYGKDALCGHNPATGREALLAQSGFARSAAAGRVVVIGGGPAGMEAARVARLVGHEVVLFEAADALGGQLRLAQLSETRRQIWSVAEWLIAELERLAVDVRLNTYIEAEEAMALAPDRIVVATGGLPRPGAFEGADLLTDPWDALAARRRLGGRVLVYDEIGQQSAIAVVETALRAGAEVDLVTPDRDAAHELGPTTRAVAMRALQTGGVTVLADTELAGVSRDGNMLTARLAPVYGGAPILQRYQHVVADLGLVALDDVYHDLVARSAPSRPGDADASGGRAEASVDRIGDAVAGRNIHAALLDARRLFPEARATAE